MQTNRQTETPERASPAKNAKPRNVFSTLRLDMRIALVYAVFGGFWILLSDRLLAAVESDPAALTQLQTYKGWAFVAASALLIFLLVWRELKALAAAEQQTRLSEERFSKAFHTSPAGMTITRIADGKFIDVNESFCRMFEFSREDVIGHTSTELNMWTPEERKKLIDEQIRSGGLQDFELQARAKSGRVVTILFSSRPIQLDGETCHITTMIDITERKQAEAALHQSENRHRIFSELTSDFVYVFRVEPDGKVVGDWISDSIYRVIGYSPEKYRLLDSAFQTIHPDDRDLTQQMLAKVIAGEKVTYEARTVTESGDARWLQNWIQPVWDDQERRVVAFYGAGKDITDRKLAERELLRNEQVLRLFVEHSPAAIAMFDREMKYIVASARYLIDYDLGGQDVVGRSHYEVFPEIPERWKEIHRRCLAGAIEKAEEDPFPRLSGKTDWIRWEIRPWHEADGEIGGLILFSEVITERKRSLEQVRYQATLLANVNDAVIASDENFALTSWNRAAERIYGWTAEEAIGKPGAKILQTEFLSISRPEAIKQLIESGEYLAEVINPRKDGVKIYIETRTTALRDPNGKTVGYVSINRDITERKRAEREVHLRAEQQAALYVLGRRVTSSFSVEEVAEAVLDEITRTITPDLAMLFLREGENLSLLGSRSPAHGLHHDETPVHRVGECLCGLAAKEAQAIYSTDIHTDLRCTWMECKQAGVVSFAALPLRAENQILGVIGLASKAEYDFSATASFLETLADQAALGLRNARLYKDLQGRLVALTAIYEASQRLQKLLNPAELSGEIIELLEKTLAYEYGAVLLVEENSGRLVPFAVAGSGNGAEFVEKDKAYIASHELRAGKGITGWVAERGESVRLGDVRKDERYYDLRSVDIRSELCVPLLAGEKTIGVINVETTRPDAYGENDQRVLETVAAQISVAIQNARLLEETRLHRDRLAELSKKLVEAREAESRAIGRELHDQVGQMLTALKLTLEVAPQLPPEQSAKKMAGAQELLDELMTRVSRLSLDLRPPMLDDLGLVPALLWHVNRFQEQAHIEVDFHHSGAEGIRFAPEIETTAYRVVQEALTNVARHARATRARLEVHARGGEMEIQVEDDGAGFDVESALAQNRGLGGIRERVNLLGGSFQIESQIGKGARKIIRLPLT